MATPDITVRGAGIFGLSVAWACVQRGAKVQIIDPNGTASGSSGGVVGALAPHVPENWNPKKQFQLESLLMAERYWENIEATCGLSAGYACTGRLQPIANEAALALAQSRVAGAEALWQGKASWSIMQTDSPWAPNSPTGQFIFDTLSARIHPRQACAALAAALATKGVTVKPDGPNTSTVVWATGVAGLRDLNARHSRNMGNGVKGQAALLEYNAPDAPQLFADTLHIIPHSDGTIGIGSTSESTYDNPTNTDSQLDDIIARARAAVPALQNAPLRERWAGIRPRSRSRAPMLGAWPDKPGHFIANGGFKIGFGMAPKVGDVMAALLLEHDNTIPNGFEITASL